jgi:hypothetical protein
MLAKFDCRFSKSADCSRNEIVVDTDRPESLEESVICDDCKWAIEATELHFKLVHRLVNMRDVDDLQELERFFEHLFGVREHPGLTAAGFRSLTPGQRRELEGQDDEFKPQAPEPI